MNDSKVAITVSKIVSILQMLAGIAIVFLFGLCTIFYLTDKEFAADTGVSFLIFCLVLDVLGILLIILSIKKSRLMKEFKKYVTVISCNPSGYIPDIAASLGVSEAVVKKNLEQMIKKMYFANAFIDYNSNCIVIANRQKTANTYVAPAASRFATMVTVKCKGCGGINTIQKGAVGECDYCGSSITGE